MKVIVWGFFTGTICWACGAGAYVASPAWSASIVHVPAPMNDTVEPEIVHTELEDASIVNVTARLDVAVAVTV